MASCEVTSTPPVRCATLLAFSAVYLAGEARTVQWLRRHFVSERGWPRQLVHTKPFWAPGKRGLE